MKTYRLQRGFTLLETLVAIAILTISVAGPLYAASRALLAAETARDQLTASYLAQAGIEHVRQVRDNDYLSARSAGGAGVSQAAWNSFLSVAAACTAPASCVYDDTSLQYAVCAGTCPPFVLYGGQYRQSNFVTGGTATPFTRAVTLSAVSATDEKVVSTVTWSSHGAARSVSITDHLTPWQ